MASSMGGAAPLNCNDIFLSEVILRKSIGVWIWHINLCEGGNVDAIVSKAKEAGIGWLAVKCGDAYRSAQWFGPNAEKFIKKCHKAKIQVYTWNFSRPQTWPAEVSLIQSCFKQNIDGHIINAENEWIGFEKEAENFMKTLRNKVGTEVFLAHSPRAIYNLNATFPYAQFGKYTDAVMPQAYWTELNKPMSTICDLMDKGFADFAKAHPDSVKPINPIGITYGKGSPGVKGLFSTDDMQEFIQRYKGSFPSLFSWDSFKSFAHVYPHLVKMNKQDLFNQDPIEVPEEVVSEILTSDIVVEQPAPPKAFVEPPASERVYPRPVSQEFIEAMKNAGARDGLIKALEKSREVKKK